MRFYHASPEGFSPGDLVAAGYPAHYQDKPEDHVYFCDTSHRADLWAEDITSEAGREAIVYLVEPTGSYHDDPYPEDLWEGTGRDYRSEEPLRVLGRAPGY